MGKAVHSNLGSSRRQGRLGGLLRKLPLLMVVVGLTVFLVLFVLLPIGSILVESLLKNGALDLSGFLRMLRQRFLRQTVKNSLVLATTVSVIATSLAFALAYCTTQFKLKGLRFLEWVILLPIVSPPFVISLAAILLFGKVGLVTKNLLGLNTSFIYGFPGLVFAQTFALFPLAYILLVGTLGNLDPSVEENAQNLGASPWKTFTSVTLPMATPGIAAAMLLVFVQSIADIGNPMLLGGDYHVLAAQVYFQLMGSYNPQGGAILAVILLIPSITAFVLQKFWAERRSYVSITGKTARTRQKTSDPLAVGLGTALCSTVAFIILLFYGMVFVGAFSKLWGIDYSFTLRNFNHIFFLRDTRPIFHTLQLSAVAAPISGIIGIIVAYVLVRKRFIGKNVLEVVSVLSLAVPGVILGIGYAIFFNKPPFILSGTATIIILSFVVRTMPIGIRAGVAGLQQIDPGLEEASANLGASSSQTLKRVVIPLLRPAFFAGLLNAFIRSMTSISAVIFLISARWQLLTAAILAAVEIGQLGLAAAYAAVLIVLTSVFMGLLRFGLNRLGKTPTDLSC